MRMRALKRDQHGPGLPIDQRAGDQFDAERSEKSPDRSSCVRQIYERDRGAALLERTEPRAARRGIAKDGPGDRPQLKPPCRPGRPRLGIAQLKRIRSATM